MGFDEFFFVHIRLCSTGLCKGEEVGKDSERSGEEGWRAAFILIDRLEHK